MKIFFIACACMFFTACSMLPRTNALEETQKDESPFVVEQQDNPVQHSILMDGEIDTISIDNAVLFFADCTNLSSINLSGINQTTTPIPVDKKKPQAEKETLLTVGEIEYVAIDNSIFNEKARIDTGATTTSLDAVEIQEFERDGKRWVSFKTRAHAADKDLLSFKRPIVRVVKIKRHNAEPVKRFVVELPLILGNIKRTVEVNLADRDQFEFSILVGRNFLDGFATVDVSSKFLTLDKINKN